MTLLIDGLAVARIARLVTRDSLTIPMRERVRVGVEEGRLPLWAEELVNCPWCVAMWAALGAGVARRAVPRVWEPAARVLAVAMLGGAVADRA